MKGWMWTWVGLALAGELRGGELVTVPWTEFKQLYGESIERRVMAQVERPAAKPAPWAYTIDEAVYRLDIGPEHAAGDVLISGRVVSGDPESIPLFGPTIVLTGTARLQGGTLTAGTGSASRGAVAFLPTPGSNTFQAALSFLVPSREDNTSRLVTFPVPATLKNVLHLSLAEDMELIDPPGIRDAQGAYHLPACEAVAIRFRNTRDVAAATVVDVDTASQVRVHGRRAIVHTTFTPARRLEQSFVLEVPAEATFASSSLGTSWIRARTDGAYDVQVPPANPSRFTIDFALPESTPGHFEFELPRIRHNNAKAGTFAVDEPEDGEITVSGGDGAAVRLTLTRFAAVRTPAVVLDEQSFYVSFEENGNVLSVLAMQVPAAVGSRLKVQAVPGAEIWSLTVNGLKRKLYADEEGRWIIPLAAGETSRVELAMLQKGEKLKLHGRLDVLVPVTDLPAQKVRVGVALPARVQLMTLEGPVSPANGSGWSVPGEFVGQRHYFEGAFYKGKGMALAVAYKEPVE